MKKLLSLVLVLIFVFGGTAIAAEKFNLSGQYRAEFYSTDNTNDNDDSIEDGEAYVDQRFRLQFDFTPADNVKAILRGDFAETNWGTVSNTTTVAPTAWTTTSGIGYRPNAADSSTIMIDKAYVDLTTAMINWKVGLFGHAGFGKGVTTDNQGANIMITADFAPVTVTGLWTKVDEGTSVIDDLTPTTGAAEDHDVMGIQVGYKTDAFGVGGFYALSSDKNDGTQDNEATVIGLYGDASMGIFSFWAEYDIYGGKNDVTNMDYVGNVLTANVVAAVSDQLKLTSTLIWAAGNTTATDMQIQNGLTSDSAFDPLDLGWNDAIGEFWDLGGDGDQFEANAGAKLINLKADFIISDAFSVYGGFAWSTPDVEDPNGDNMYLDGVTVFAIGGAYNFLPGTSFKLGYESASRSSGGTVAMADDAATKIMGALFVNF